MQKNIRESQGNRYRIYSTCIKILTKFLYVL